MSGFGHHHRVGNSWLWNNFAISVGSFVPADSATGGFLPRLLTPLEATSSGGDDFFECRVQSSFGASDPRLQQASASRTWFLPTREPHRTTIVAELLEKPDWVMTTGTEAPSATFPGIATLIW